MAAGWSVTTSVTLLPLLVSLFLLNALLLLLRILEFTPSECWMCQERDERKDCVAA